MGKSTAARTLEYLRDDGWPLVSLVERYNIYSQNYNDLFGFADVMAIHPYFGTLLIQVTSGSHVNARLNKIRTEAFEEAEYAVRAMNVGVEVHGWRKVKVCTKCKKIRFGPDRACGCKKPKPGTRLMWMPKIVDVTLEVLHEVKPKDWDKITEVMLKAGDLIDNIDMDNWYVSWTFDQYPPAIVIGCQIKPGRGSYYEKFSIEELGRASELAMQATAAAREAYPGLTIRSASFRKTPSQQSSVLFYELRPRKYNEFLKEIKDA